MSIYDRWGIQQTDDERWETFVNRLFLLLNDGNNNMEVSRSIRQLIAYQLGRKMDEIGHSASFTSENYIEINNLINHYKTPFEIARNLEALMDLVSEGRQNMIQKLVSNSNCGFSLAKSDGNWTAFPEGDKYLDKKLVEDPLSFLSGKPATEFRKALEEYSNNKSVQSAEKTRRALEEYIRQIFNSPKLGLEQGIKKYGLKIKDDGVPQHIRDLLVRDLNLMNGHYNDSSKHQSETTPHEAEYLIYKAGTLFRIMDILKRAEQKSPPEKT